MEFTNRKRREPRAGGSTAQNIRNWKPKGSAVPRIAQRLAFRRRQA